MKLFGDSSRDDRLTAFRGFPPFREARDARAVRSLWETRLRDASPGHPFWMHVHVPYCPQLCAFCHCGKELLRRDSELDGYLERTRDEVEFFAPALRGARVAHQYFGGGTPNLLSPAQLDALLDLLEAHFDHDHAERRTLEILPSAYRAGTLEVAARHGVQRISCGVQSSDTRVLKKVGRKDDLTLLSEIFERADALGVRDVNVDLAWGLPGETETGLFRSLSAVLALAPTSVSIHFLIPTPKFSAFGSDAEEAQLYRRFRALADHDEARGNARPFIDYEWRRLPTVMALVRKDYVARGEYRSFQYSDMESVGIDMFGLGTFSLSHVLSLARYENQTSLARFDPDEPGYRVAAVDGLVDAAMDALGDLLRDGTTALGVLRDKYGDAAHDGVREVLDGLLEERAVEQAGGTYRYSGGDSERFGPPGDLLDLALSRTRALNARAITAERLKTPPSEGFELEVGGVRVAIRVEKARPNRHYFATAGGFGISHAKLASSPRELKAAMQNLTRHLAALVTERPRSLDELTRELARRALASSRVTL